MDAKTHKRKSNQTRQHVSSDEEDILAISDEEVELPIFSNSLNVIFNNVSMSFSISFSNTFDTCLTFIFRSMVEVKQV